MNEKSLEITVTHNIKAEDIENLLDSAGRGASYWAESLLEYASEVNKVLYEGCEVSVQDTEDEKEYKLDKEKVMEGLILMSKTQPRHYADFLSGNADDTTGDVFLQCAILKDVIYG